MIAMTSKRQKLCSTQLVVPPSKRAPHLPGKNVIYPVLTILIVMNTQSYQGTLFFVVRLLNGKMR
jgi:hypothetical protein